MDKKYIQSKLRDKLNEVESPIEEANYIVKADDIDKVGDKLEAKLDDDDVVKVVDEAELEDCPCNGKCKKGAKCKKTVEESVRPKMTKDQLIESVVRNGKTIISVQDFISENTNAPITLDGQKIDVSSIEIDGVEKKDYPNFVDAYFSYVEFEGGIPLTDSELEKLTDEQSELVNTQIHSKQLF